MPFPPLHNRLIIPQVSPVVIQLRQFNKMLIFKGDMTSGVVVKMIAGQTQQATINSGVNEGYDSCRSH
jgi:hypothetical protein